jgi:hypothetical protein
LLWALVPEAGLVPVAQQEAGVARELEALETALPST